MRGHAVQQKSLVDFMVEIVIKVNIVLRADQFCSRKLNMIS